MLEVVKVAISHTKQIEIRGNHPLSQESIPPHDLNRIKWEVYI